MQPRARRGVALVTISTVVGVMLVPPSTAAAETSNTPIGADRGVAFLAPLAVDIATPITAAVLVENAGAAPAPAPTHVLLLAAGLGSATVDTGRWQCLGPTGTMVGLAWSCDLPDDVSPGAWGAPIVVRGAALATVDVVTLVAVVDDPGGASSANDTARADITIRRPRLAVSIAPSYSAIARGAVTTLTVWTRNDGVAPVAPVLSLTPTGFNAMNPNGAGWTCTPVPVVCRAAQPLAATATAPPLHVTLTAAPVDTAGALDAVVLSGTGPPADAAARAVVAIGDHPDLAPSIAPPALPLVPGRPADFAVTVANVGRRAGAGPIAAVLQTNGLDEPRGSGTGWQCDPSEDDTVECSRSASLAPGASTPPITLRGTVTATHPESVDVGVDAEMPGDLHHANDSTSITAPVVPPVAVSIDIDDNGALPSSGGTIAYAVRVHNAGYEAAAGVATVDIETTGANLLGGGPGWQCGVDGCTHPGPIAAGGTLPVLTFGGTVVAPPGGVVHVQVGVSHDEDETSGDDTDAETTPVAAGDTLPPNDVQISGLGDGDVSRTSPVAVRWSATDPSGIRSYDVETRQLKWNDGNQPGWSSWKHATSTTTATVKLSVGRTLCARVRAEDSRGNRSAWSASRCTAMPLRADQFDAGSGWTRVKNGAAYGGSVQRATQTGSVLTRTGVHADKLALLVTTCPSCGTLRVRWNGATVANVSLKSTATLRSVPITVATWATPATGTVTVEVTSANKTVEVEGLAVFRD